MSVPLLASGPPVGFELDPMVAIALAILFVLINGFFVAAEFALVKVRPTQLEPYVERGDRRGRLARHMLAHLDAYLSASQLGITLASLALGWVGEPAFALAARAAAGRRPRRVAERWCTRSSLTVAFLRHHRPAHRARRAGAEVARHPQAGAAPRCGSRSRCYAFYKVTYPVIWLLNHAANGLLRLFGIKPADRERARAQRGGAARCCSTPSTRASCPSRSASCSTTSSSSRTALARQIMVPRADVVYLSTTRSHGGEPGARAQRRPHPLPALRGRPRPGDRPDPHQGPVPRAERRRARSREIARAITFVPETLPARPLLRRMRAERVHLAAVLDEYGGVTGIVTLENVIEEIVGEIQDEFDFEKPELVPLGRRLLPGRRAPCWWRTSRTSSTSSSPSATRTPSAGVVLSELGRRAARRRRGAHRPPRAAGPGDRRQPHPHPATHRRDAQGSGAGGGRREVGAAARARAAEPASSYPAQRVADRDRVLLAVAAQRELDVALRPGSCRPPPGASGCRSGRRP